VKKRLPAAEKMARRAIGATSNSDRHSLPAVREVAEPHGSAHGVARGPALPGCIVEGPRLSAADRREEPAVSDP
jgi:hypothetical protein